MLTALILQLVYFNTVVIPAGYVVLLTVSKAIVAIVLPALIIMTDMSV